MNSKRLKLSELKVRSFVTQAESGKIKGGTDTIMSDDTKLNTCIACTDTCQTCDYSCNGTCQTCNTCVTCQTCNTCTCPYPTMNEPACLTQDPTIGCI